MEKDLSVTGQMYFLSTILLAYLSPPPRGILYCKPYVPLFCQFFLKKDSEYLPDVPVLAMGFLPERLHHVCILCLLVFLKKINAKRKARIIHVYLKVNPTFSRLYSHMHSYGIIEALISNAN